MSKIVLYGMDISPPVRACLLTLRALEVPFEYKDVNLLAGEHMSEEFLEKNPQHTVPLLDDDGALIWDSHAICCYLVDKYSKSDELYPKDLVKRAQLEQRLYFDASILFMSLRNISIPYFYHNVAVVPQEKIDNVNAGYKHLEAFLGDNSYLTGENITIADFCCGATASSLPAVLDIDPETYPKITAWLDRLNLLPYFNEVNNVGAEKYINMLKNELTVECS
ncbi:glutathione S-transferase 1 [Drosophila busckii]|uniref:glutathione S-transferase 1 n=1 Tax=Drosophila busckii TaxID=30019 RepID=UPI001432FF52|nr:glutathione S-transferase 1 [Drosophila busckii]